MIHRYTFTLHPACGTKHARLRGILTFLPFTLLAMLADPSAATFAQQRGASTAAPQNTSSSSATVASDPEGATRSIPANSAVTTQHTVTVNGVRIPYQATVGTQPVWNAEGEPIATLHYTYYTRSDVKDRASRPLLISFNGGPGSASLWMHLAYTGPRVLNLDDEGYPVQPYGVRENPYSVLDVADIVYVNPVNTGYSRILDSKVDGAKLFFGVNQDIAYLADWITTFVTRNERWPSPKFLIGESYGTTRVSGLAHALQNRGWMYLNGVILVSPTDIGIERDGPVDAANRIPYFTAAAWYHRKLPTDLQSLDLLEVLERSERFTREDLLPALYQGGAITTQERDRIAREISRYSGLSVESVLSQNLDIPTSFFWKELLREEGFTIGRLDSRYLGIDAKSAGVSTDYNAELDSWEHSFTPAINHYMRTELQFRTDIPYNVFGPVRPWDSSGDRTGEQLRLAMAQNPYLRVMIQAGYYDGATTYYDAKYSMWHLDPSGRLSDRIRFEGYRSGHMMYLRREDLKTSNEHVRDFIMESLPGKGEPAKYER